MTKFNHYCEICNKTLKDSRNSLSLHISNHQISKEEYYKKYIDSRCTCKSCGSLVKFKNLQIGFSEYCKSCAIKVKQWSGDRGDKRKKLFSDLLENRGGGSSISKGRPKGSKNKRPYPVTEAVQSRYDAYKGRIAEWNKDPSKIEKQKTSWASKPESEILEFNKKRTESSMSKGHKFHQGKYSPKSPKKYLGDPTCIFYRSSWELKFFNWLDSSDFVVGWSSEEIVIPYRCPTDDKIHRYFPDVKAQIRNKDGLLKTYLIEVKPAKQTQPPVYPGRNTQRYLTESMTYIKNQAKWKAATEWAKDRGYEFKIITEYELGLTT